jgi:hypothetical protein
MISDFHIGRRIAVRDVEAAMAVDAMVVKAVKAERRRNRMMRARVGLVRNPVP